MLAAAALVWLMTRCGARRLVRRNDFMRLPLSAVFLACWWVMRID